MLLITLYYEEEIRAVSSSILKIAVSLVLKSVQRHMEMYTFNLQNNFYHVLNFFMIFLFF